MSGFILGFEVLEDRLAPASVSGIKAQIREQFPDINTVDDVQRVNYLRQWAYETVAVGGVQNLDRSPEVGYYDRTLTQLYDLFERNVGTVMCGGTAFFLGKLVGAYGYEWGRVSVGFQPSGTHVVTLVTVKVGGDTKTIVEDAHTNSLATFEDGSPMGIRRLYWLAATGRGDQVHWQEGPSNGRPGLVAASDLGRVLARGRWWFDPTVDSREFTMVRPGVFLLVGTATPDRLEEVWWRRTGTHANIVQNHPKLPAVFASSFGFVNWADGKVGAEFEAWLPPAAHRVWAV